jgi:hypothetical protein
VINNRKSHRWPRPSRSVRQNSWQQSDTKRDWSAFISKREDSFATLFTAITRATGGCPTDFETMETPTHAPGDEVFIAFVLHRIDGTERRNEQRCCTHLARGVQQLSQRERLREELVRKPNLVRCDTRLHKQLQRNLPPAQRVVASEQTHVKTNRRSNDVASG